MSDFKFSDMGFSEGESSKKRDKNKLKLLIILGVSILVFIIVLAVVFAVVNSKNNKKEVVKQSEKILSITDSSVTSAYNLVNFSYQGIRYDKFIKNKKVDYSSLSNYDKVFLTLSQIQPSDLTKVDVDENGYYIYSISESIFNSYLTKMLGSKAYIDNNYLYGITEDTSNLVYTFNIKPDEKNNTGLVYYDSSSRNFMVKFNSNVENKEEKLTDLGTHSYLTKITSAKITVDNELIIEEAIVYLNTSKSKDASGNVIENTFDLNIYKDYNMTQKIAYLPNKTKDNFNESIVTIEKFIDSNINNVITYTFKWNSGRYYFYSSNIKY